MKYAKIKRAFKETASEFLVVLKRVGLPFVIFGGAFVVYSWKRGKAVIPFSQFMIVLIFLLLIQVNFENVWLQKEVENLKEKIRRMEETCKNR